MVLQAVTNAWAIVDNVHRLGVLVRKLPGLKRGPAVAVLLKAAGQVEPFRHAVQHLDGEIEGLLADGRPLWDSLSWVNWGTHRRTDWSALALRLLDAGGQSE